MPESAFSKALAGVAKLGHGSSAALFRPWRVLPHADDNQGSVVSGGTVLPCVDAVEDGPLHLRQRLLRGLSYDTAQPIDAQFLVLRVEAFVEAVRVDDHAIAGLK